MRDTTGLAVTHVWRNMCGVDLGIVADEVLIARMRREIVRVRVHRHFFSATVQATFCDRTAMKAICDRVAVRRKMARRGEY